MGWRLQPSSLTRWLRISTARGIWAAVAILVGGLTFTLLLAYSAQADVRAKAQLEFDFACNEIRSRIDDRLLAHAQLLASGAALFDSTGTVTRQQWKTFVDRQQVDEYLPGITGTGFAQLIPPDQLDEHIRQVRAEGFPDYTVLPPGKRDVYSSIVYLEPFSGRNLRAFGYDMFSEPVRRAAMERARDENAPALSGKVTLVQETDEDVQAGTLMYVPVYAQGMSLNSVEQRRAALRGWVYSPYRMTDLLSSVLGDWGDQPGKHRVLEVYDGDQMVPDALLYDSHDPANPAEAGPERFSQVTPVDFAGRRWTLRCAEAGAPLAAASDLRVLSVLAGGIITSLLLAGLMLSVLDTRYRARELAHQLTGELRQSEVKYRTVAMFTYDWEAWRRPDGTYVYCSPSCERITGYTAEEFMADPGLLLRIMHPDDRAGWDDHLYHAADGEADSPRELDFRIVKPTGEERWISHTCQPVYGDDGQYLGRRESNRDSTVRKRQEVQVIERSAQLAEAVEELQRAAKMKDEFLSAISHELRTPLHGVMAMAEVLELSASSVLNERQLRYVQAIHENGTRLLTLINRILRYANLAAGKVTIAAQTCRLQDLAAIAERQARPQAEQKGLTFDVAVEPQDLAIVSDTQAIGEILQALLDNAIKFTPTGGHIGLKIRRVPGAQFVELEVWDTGIGVAAEDCGRLFQPFTQADGSLARQYEGLGLGLATVQRLVELLYGTVAVHSEPGKGSCFVVTLPDRPLGT